MALNRKLDATAARKIVEIFTEVIIAPEADDEALAILAAKKNLRALARRFPPQSERGVDPRRAVGGRGNSSSRDRDNGVLEDGKHSKVVTKRGSELRARWPTSEVCVASSPSM